jgi:4-amino-4-deoxy-L-arabinose transferase-like glycosyltransferase
MGKPSRAFVTGLLAIAAIALGIRLGYIFHERIASGLNAKPGVVGGDAFFYQQGAVLLPHHGFISPEIFVREGRLVQSAEHPPMYLLWLGLLSFAHITSAGAMMIWSAVLGTGTVVIVGLLGREVRGELAGLIAAAFAATYANIWALDGFLMSETMALFTATLAIWLAYRYWHRPSTGRLVALSVGVAFATLSRAELGLLFVIVVLPLVLIRPPRADASRVRMLAIAAVVGIIPLLPWTIFNTLRFDEPVYLSTGFGITLASANCDATYYAPFTGYWNRDCAQRIREEDITPDMDQSEQDPVFRRKALDYIEAHRSRVPVVIAARWGRITGSWNPWQQVSLERFIEGRGPWLAKGALLSWWFLLPLAVAGAFALRGRGVPIFPLLALPVTVLVAITLTFATGRYRATAESVLCVLAACAIASLVDALRSRPRAADVDLTAPVATTEPLPAPTP